MFIYLNFIYGAYMLEMGLAFALNQCKVKCVWWCLHVVSFHNKSPYQSEMPTYLQDRSTVEQNLHLKAGSQFHVDSCDSFS